jgi:hypothetical protein
MLKADVKRLILNEESEKLFVFDVVDCERLVIRLSTIDHFHNKAEFNFHVLTPEELHELKKLIKTIK